MAVIERKVKGESGAEHSIRISPGNKLLMTTVGDAEVRMEDVITAIAIRKDLEKAYPGYSFGVHGKSAEPEVKEYAYEMGIRLLLSKLKRK
jgi:hypothetical protein